MSDEPGISALGMTTFELRPASWRGSKGMSPGFEGVAPAAGGKDDEEFKFREASTGGFVVGDIGSSTPSVP